MNMVPHAARLEAGARPLPSAGDTASALIQAATTLTAVLAQGRAVDARTLRAAMEAAFGASDSAGAWVWKDAYEAGEVAQVRQPEQIRHAQAPHPQKLESTHNKPGSNLWVRSLEVRSWVAC